MSHSTDPVYGARRGGPVGRPYPRTPCAIFYATTCVDTCVHECLCVYDAIMRARYFPATTAKLPAIDNYTNYAIKLFIQAVPDSQRGATIEIT